MTVQSFTFGCFQTNTYVLSDEKKILLIDPACQTPLERQELSRYIAGLQAESGQPKVQIMATHGHLDHLWGAAWAAEQWHTPVLIPTGDIPMAERMQEQYDMFGIGLTAKPFPMADLQAEIAKTHQSFRLIPTPGHTPGSVCFYWETEKILISGDTLFHYGYGRTDLPGGDSLLLSRSLTQLMDLSSDTRVFPGHGESTTIGAERPFYRL